MKTLTESYDVVVCGGGLAGLSTAVAAARHGAKTILLHDRPVLGGNSSTEVRVTTHGAGCFHNYARETGIISELLVEERALNHEAPAENGWINSVWDVLLYDLCQNTPNLTLSLNTSVVDVVFDDGSSGLALAATPAAQANRASGYYHRPACNPRRRLRAVVAQVAAAETTVVIEGHTFIDCTGDAVVSDLAGCEWRMGTEGREEFDEPHAPARPSTDTMGNSIQFKAVDIGRPAPFTPPSWAVKYDNPDFFYKQGRQPYEVRCGYWWIEIGMPWDTIHDAEDIRHELTRHILGVWDWIKNKDPLTKDRARNLALDWVGQVPGKRESRRVIGRYFMNSHDPLSLTVFPDEIAYGGWFLDLHTPGGLLAATSEQTNAENYAEKTEYAVKSYCGPYGIPLRILIAKDLDNLLFAGRNVSVTHAALGTVRVMSTTSLMGQAVGTAAAIARRDGVDVCDLPDSRVQELQQKLLRDGCFLPNVRNADPADQAREATVSASSQALVTGATPEDHDYYAAVLTSPAYNAPPGGTVRLEDRVALWIAVSTEHIDRLSLCLTNPSGRPQTVQVELHHPRELWDYRTMPAPTLASATLEVPAGKKIWVDWPVGVAIPSGGWVRLDALPNPELLWEFSGAILPGHVIAYEMAPGKLRRYGPGQTTAFRIDPPQAPFGPEQVISGVTRPQHSTNLWRSAPAQPLPQWLELRWPEPRRIGLVQLTFPGHLLREYHGYPPFYRDPQCPADYAIEAWDAAGGTWRPALEITGNYQTRRRHHLPEAVTTDRLRILITATNGDPCAAIYEVRCET